MKSSGPRKKSTPEERLQRIRKQIIDLEHVCSGTLVHRTKVCGKPGCACAADRAARHGPYYQWSRWEKDRRVYMSVPETAAPAMARAIRNHRRLRRLMRLWERDSVRVLLEEAKRKSR
jgi:hypothetical protein